MPDPLMDGWWVRHKGLSFPIKTGSDFPIKRGEGLDADVFEGNIVDPEGVLEDFFNFRDPIEVFQDGAKEFEGRGVEYEWDEDNGLLGLRVRDYWHGVWERATRDERYVNTEVADLVRRALGLKFTIREAFLNADRIDFLEKMVATGGRLRLKREANGDFPTGDLYFAESVNLGRPGAVVEAVTLQVVDRVGTDPVEIFEPLIDDSKMNDAETTALFDEDLALIRLPSVANDRVFPFDDLSQTEQLIGGASIQGGKLTLATEAVLDAGFLEGDSGSLDPEVGEESSVLLAGLPVGTDPFAVWSGGAEPELFRIAAGVIRRHLQDAGAWVLHDPDVFDELTLGFVGLETPHFWVYSSSSGHGVNDTGFNLSAVTQFTTRHGAVARKKWATIAGDEFADVNIAARGLITTNGATPGNQQFWLNARTHPHGVNGYRLMGHPDGSGSRWRIERYSGEKTVEETLGDETSGVALTSKFWARFEVTGTTLRARVWADGSPEPETWLMSVVDSTHATGYVWFGGQSQSGSTAPTLNIDSVVLTVPGIRAFEQRHKTGFHEYTPGVPPEDWLAEEIVSGGTWNAFATPWENQLRMTMPSGGGVIRVRWPKVNGDQPMRDLDILGSVQKNNDGLIIGRVYFRDGYYLEFSGSAITLRDPDGNSLGSRTWPQAVDHRVLFRLRAEGGTIRVRVWRHSATETRDPEPDTWDIESTGNPVAPGRVRLEANQASGSGRTIQWGILDVTSLDLYDSVEANQVSPDGRIYVVDVNGLVHSFAQGEPWVKDVGGPVGLVAPAGFRLASLAWFTVAGSNPERIVAAMLSDDEKTIRFRAFRNTPGGWERISSLEAGLGDITAAAAFTRFSLDYVGFTTDLGSMSRERARLVLSARHGSTDVVRVWEFIGDSWRRQERQENDLDPAEASFATVNHPAGGESENFLLTRRAASVESTMLWSRPAITAVSGQQFARFLSYDNLRGSFNPTRRGRMDTSVRRVTSKETYCGVGPKAYGLRVNSDGDVQIRTGESTWAALPTPTSIAADTTTPIILMWDHLDEDSGEWSAEVFVGGSSKGVVSPWTTETRDLAEVWMGRVEHPGLTPGDHDGRWSGPIVYDGHDPDALDGQWISTNLVDPNVHHAFEFLTDMDVPEGGTVEILHSRDDGVTWTTIDPDQFEEFLTVSKSSAKTKLRVVLSAVNPSSRPSIESLTVKRYYRYVDSERKWESIKLGDEFPARKMRVSIIDENGLPAKALPPGTSIAIDVTPDGWSNQQTIADGGEAIFDTSLLAAPDWRVRVRVNTTDEHNTPEVRSFLLEVEPDGVGQVLRYFVSRDARQTFHPVAPGVKFTGFGGAESPQDQLHYRVEAENEDENSSPEVRDLTLVAETQSDMPGIREGTINPWNPLPEFVSRVEYYGDMLKRIQDVTGIQIRRRFDPATGEQVIDWNTEGASPTIIEVTRAQVRRLRTRRSVESQANRVVYSGGTEG